MARAPRWDPTDKTIHRTFRTGTFARGVAFLNAIAPIADELNHHPDVILTSLAVIITLTTHDVGHVTDADYDLAERINTVWNDFAAG